MGLGVLCRAGNALWGLGGSVGLGVLCGAWGALQEWELYRAGSALWGWEALRE